MQRKHLSATPPKMNHTLTYTVIQSNPDGHDTSVEYTVRVTEDFKLDMVVSIHSFSLLHLRSTDITYCLMEYLRDEIYDMLSEVNWKEVYQGANHLNVAV